jgi:hypothetical protein
MQPKNSEIGLSGLPTSYSTSLKSKLDGFGKSPTSALRRMARLDEVDPPPKFGGLTNEQRSQAGWIGALKCETFEKCSILPAQLNPYLIFNRGSSPRKAKILTTPVRSSGPTGQAGIH